MIVESYEDVIVLSGALRSNFWETIHTAISLTLKRHPTGVIIDCSGITEITPDGAETFHDALDFIEEHQRARIVVAAVPPAVMEVLRQVPEVRSQLPVAATVEDARRSLDLLVEDPDAPRKKPGHAKDCDQTILVCLSGDDSDDHLIGATIESVERRPSRVVLVHPIIVPRELPLTAPMPDEEQHAASRIASSRDRLEAKGVPVDVRIERARDLPSLIEDLAEANEVAQVLLGVSTRPRHEDQAWRALLAVIQKVKRPLVFVRGPLT